MDDRPIEDMTDEEVDAYLKARGFTEEKMAMANLKVLRAVNARLRDELADLRARLAAVTQERDRLREACEQSWKDLHNDGPRFHRLVMHRLRAALAKSADAGEEVAGG